MTDTPSPSRGPLRRHWRSITTAIVAGTAGAVFGRLFPPFVIDGTFLRDFVTSAGFGGVMALVAATVAYLGVTRSGQRAARSAAEALEQKNTTDARAHYWTRFTYAAERALSEEDGQSKFGILLLIQLADQDWMNIEDNQIAFAVAEVIIGVRPPDGDSTTAPEGGVQ